MFRMFYTPEDFKILQFVEKFGFITIKECQNLFYPQAKGYEMARKHLNKLVDYSKLSLDKKICAGKNLYYIDKRPSSYHSVLTMDYYTELIKHGANVIYFKREQEWLEGKYRSDAYCCYHINDRYFFDIVESVKTNKVEANKYIEVYDSNEGQNLTDNILEQLGSKRKNLFPRLVIIDDVVRDKPVFINNNVDIIFLNYNLDDFARLFVT